VKTKGAQGETEEGDEEKEIHVRRRERDLRESSTWSPCCAEASCRAKMLQFHWSTLLSASEMAAFSLAVAS
jgi:hypothetical protein